MKKLLIAVVLAAAAAVTVPCSAPAAPVLTGHHREFEEIVVGPFEHEHRAHEEAERLRDRGFHAEVFFRDGWQVRAWRR
jgi:hypothetical protein